MAWEENSCISLNMQLIAILSRIGVKVKPTDGEDITDSRLYPNIVISRVAHFPILEGNQVHSNLPLDNLQITSSSSEAYHCLEI